MSDEPQPLRLKPRPQTAGAGGAVPEAPAAPAAPAAPQDSGDGSAKLRLKPRLSLAPEPAQAAPLEPPPEPAFVDPAPAPAPEAPPEEAIPVFKLRPKHAAPAPAAAPPSAPEPAFIEAPPPPPGMAASPEAFAVPPPPPAGAFAPAPGLPPPPPPGRGAAPLPPVSVLAAPPIPGASMEAPAPPGSVPKLSMGAPASAPPPPPAAKGLQIRVAEGTAKPGVKPLVKPGSVKPGKPGAKPPSASPLRKRPTLSVVAKAGIGVLVIAVAVGGLFTYRIFFPPPSKEVKISIPPIPKPVHDDKADALAKLAAAPIKVIDNGQAALAARRAAEQAKLDAAANMEDAPTPTPQTVMEKAAITKDVEVNNAPVVAAPTASAEFRAYVANASIGGVFQGKPSKALINGRIAREGSQVDSEMGIIFERIDAEKKIIYFKDANGAEVSKNY